MLQTLADIVFLGARKSTLTERLLASRQPGHHFA